MCADSLTEVNSMEFPDKIKVQKGYAMKKEEKIVVNIPAYSVVVLSTEKDLLK